MMLPNDPLRAISVTDTYNGGPVPSVEDED